MTCTFKIEQFLNPRLLLRSNGDTTEWRSVVSILDWFKPKSRAPKGLVEIKVEFTADENEAMSHTLDRYAAIANAHAAEGMRMFVPPKVRNAMSAQGLTEYVEDLKRGIHNCDSATNISTLMDKAIKAQMKAYTLHNLPVYIFDSSEEFMGKLRLG